MKIVLNGNGIKSIKELLEERGVSLYAPCAGHGTCGQCVVTVVSGECPPSEKDKKFLSPEDLARGLRLACRAFPVGEITVMTKDAASPVICEDYLSVSGAVTTTQRDGLFCGIDLGTTTIVLAALGADGRPTATRSFLNPLVRYGADVVSRLEAAANGKLNEMKDLLREKIEEELSDFADVLNKGKTVFTALAGNTVMTHIFMGWDTSGLGTYPFKPYSLSYAESNLCGAPVFVFPGISAFVGGDIVAGIYGLDLADGTDGDMLMDLGTNGEMVLKTENGLIASSASAGPALEGAHLSCGTGCVEGAVTGVTLENLRPVLTVAGRDSSNNKRLEGACGSAILELTDELLRTGILSPDGTFSSGYADEGFAFGTDRDGRVLALTQSDVRELQLAKSAVSTTALMLCDKGNVLPDSLNIRLAGGMGSGLRPERIRRTGIIPTGASVKAVGNSALGGLMRFLGECRDSDSKENAVKTLSELAGSVTVYDLALDRDFEEKFMASMSFIPSR